MTYSETVSQLISEVRTNVRLRIGVWGILAILASYGLLAVSDYQKRLQGSHHDLVQRFARLQGTVGEKEWSERASEARDLRVQAESRLWQANTRGLAQATFQSWLSEQLRKAKTIRPRLKVEPAADAGDNGTLWQVTAQLEGDFQPASLEQLFLSVAAHPNLTVVDAVDVGGNRASRFVLRLTAYFQAPGSGA